MFKGDGHKNSPYNIDSMLSIQVMRIQKIINWGITTSCTGHQVIKTKVPLNIDRYIYNVVLQFTVRVAKSSLFDVLSCSSNNNFIKA